MNRSGHNLGQQEDLPLLFNHSKKILVKDNLVVYGSEREAVVTAKRRRETDDGNAYRNVDLRLVARNIAVEMRKDRTVRRRGRVVRLVYNDAFKLPRVVLFQAACILERLDRRDCDVCRT